VLAPFRILTGSVSTVDLRLTVLNIQEIARLAGVSTATVSRTINGSGSVRPKTANRVLRLIEQDW
jgi:plasmid maintenance system antidote protein VapI